MAAGTHDLSDFYIPVIRSILICDFKRTASALPLTPTITFDIL